MLELKVQDGPFEVVLQFEHSLLSLSKWESKNKTPFLSNPNKSSVDMIDYFEEMLLNTDVPSEIVYRLSPDQLDELTEYINESRTAASVPTEGKTRPSQDVVTSDLIYCWMTMLKINWEAQHWHLSRLMMQIELVSFKNQPEKKQKPSEVMSQWASANAKVKAEYGTKG